MKSTGQTWCVPGQAGAAAIQLTCKRGKVIITMLSRENNTCKVTGIVKPYGELMTIVILVTSMDV